MATYQELLQAFEDETLNQKVKVAVIVAADTVRLEVDTQPNHAARMKWAGKALRDQAGEAKRALWAALVQNRTLTLAQIKAATDAALQTAVDAAVDLLAVE